MVTELELYKVGESEIAVYNDGGGCDSGGHVV